MHPEHLLTGSPELASKCDRTARKATELGPRIFVPEIDILNVGRVSVVADPTGAALAIIKAAGDH